MNQYATKNEIGLDYPLKFEVDKKTTLTARQSKNQDLSDNFRNIFSFLKKRNVLLNCANCTYKKKGKKHNLFLLRVTFSYGNIYFLPRNVCQ